MSEIGVQERAKLQEWLESSAYLPEFMRDFHDQKDLFKTIHEIVNGDERTKCLNWQEAHIYTIDVFLWFMARRGWTLQRSKAKQQFLDIHETLAEQKGKRYAALASLLSQNSGGRDE